MNRRAIRISSVMTLGVMLSAAAPATAAFNLFGIHGLTLAGTSTTACAIMIAGFILREWRETRKLSHDDRQARREGYATQVENLQKENRLLSVDLRDLRIEYGQYRAICHAETEDLRRGQIVLENEVAGYKRRLDGQAIEIARLSGGQASLDRLSVVDPLTSVQLPPNAKGTS